MISSKHGQPATMVLTMLLLATQGCVSQITSEIDMLAREKQRFSAIKKADVETLEAILDESLIFTHASGKIDSKESFLNTLRAGTLIYNSIDLEDVEVRLYDACAVVTGKSFLDIIVRGENRKLELLFTTVWVSDRHGWKVVAYQSTHKP